MIEPQPIDPAVRAQRVTDLRQLSHRELVAHCDGLLQMGLDESILSTLDARLRRQQGRYE